VTEVSFAGLRLRLCGNARVMKDRLYLIRDGVLGVLSVVELRTQWFAPVMVSMRSTCAPTDPAGVESQKHDL
jgi:hypothetical protein